MASRGTYTVSGDIPERTSWTHRATLLDELGQPIPLAAITTLTLTLYVQASGNPIINNVQNVNIKNTDRGQIGATDGSLILRLHAADLAILNDSLATETHVALLQCTYNAGLDGWNREIVHRVKNLARVS